MRYSLITILLLLNAVLYAQQEVNIYTERNGSDVTIYVDNPHVIPMTVDLTLQLTNMRTDFGGSKGIFVIPENSNKFKITTASSNTLYGKSGLSLESYVYIGDINKEHNRKYLYELPFESGQTYLVSQGYNGRFSHQGENAIDFGLEVGEKVYAARGGIVYKVVEEHSKSCKRSSCQQFNNYIIIYHSDGTFSEYSHLNKNGANVEVGDMVEVGDFIGNSGNTGWSSGPHLHFVVYKYNDKGERITLKTKFKTVEKASTYLKENKTYTRL